MLPSFNGQNVFLPASQDCEDVPISNCGSSRGAEIFASAPSPGFQVNASSTWTTLGYYALSQDAAYGLHGNAWYGYDNVGVSFASGGNNNVTLDHQVLAAYETHDYWLGQVGLSQFAITMNQSEHPSSFLTALKEQALIPSLSFGYQPGASHSKRVHKEVSTSETWLTGTSLYQNSWKSDSRRLRRFAQIE